MEKLIPGNNTHSHKYMNMVLRKLRLYSNCNRVLHIAHTNHCQFSLFKLLSLKIKTGTGKKMEG